MLRPMSPASTAAGFMSSLPTESVLGVPLAAYLRQKLYLSAPRFCSDTGTSSVQRRPLFVLTIICAAKRPIPDVRHGRESALKCVIYCRIFMRNTKHVQRCAGGGDIFVESPTIAPRERTYHRPESVI